MRRIREGFGLSSGGLLCLRPVMPEHRLPLEMRRPIVGASGDPGHRRTLLDASTGLSQNPYLIALDDDTGVLAEKQNLGMRRVAGPPSQKRIVGEPPRRTGGSESSDQRWRSHQLRLRERLDWREFRSGRRSSHGDECGRRWCVAIRSGYLNSSRVSSFAVADNALTPTEHCRPPSGQPRTTANRCRRTMLNRLSSCRP